MAEENSDETIRLRFERHIKVDYTLAEALALIGNIELAIRHPGNNGVSRNIVVSLAVMMIPRIIDIYPEIKEFDGLLESWSKSFKITMEEIGRGENARSADRNRDSKSDEPG